MSLFIYSQSIADVAHLCGSKSPISSYAETSFPLNNDHTVYSITKTAAVNLKKHYAEIIGFKYYILRIVAVFSPTYKKSTISIDRNKPNTTEYILVKQKKN